MAFKYKCKNPLKLISDEEIQKVHEYTLEVLEKTGVKFMDRASLGVLRDAGCDVNWETLVAKIPSDIVEDSLKKCPEKFILQARNPVHDVFFDTETVQFGPCSGMTVLDLETMTRRPGTSDDAVTSVRLTDALEIMSGANAGLGYIADVPQEINLEWKYAATLRNSEKICVIVSMGDSVKWGIEMVRAAGQDAIIPVSSSSPLCWSEEQIDAVKICIEAGFPVAIQSMASSGTSAPATMPGTSIIMNAEILAMITLIQILRPGTGVMYSCFAIPMDMKTAMLASGSIELAMLTVISAQLSRFYGVGNMVWLPMTDSKLLDEQAGYEKSMQLMLAGMAGINLIWGAGMVDNHALWANAQLIIDAEMCGMVGRYLNGIKVTEEKAAVELINDIGHFPNNFLSSDHTYDWFRKEQYFPIVSTRDEYEQWKEMGAKEILTRANEKANDIAMKHHPVPLPDKVDKEIERILGAVSKERGIDYPF